MSQPFMAEIKIISWNYPPKGWAFCNGQLLPILSLGPSRPSPEPP